MDYLKEIKKIYNGPYTKNIDVMIGVLRDCNFSRTHKLYIIKNINWEDIAESDSFTIIEAIDFIHMLQRDDEKYLAFNTDYKKVDKGIFLMSSYDDNIQIYKDILIVPVSIMSYFKALLDEAKKNNSMVMFNKNLKWLMEHTDELHNLSKILSLSAIDITDKLKRELLDDVCLVDGMYNKALEKILDANINLCPSDITRTIIIELISNHKVDSIHDIPDIALEQLPKLVNDNLLSLLTLVNLYSEQLKEKHNDR